MPLTTQELRALFLNYFKSRQHVIIPSSSLIPANDPTLLFTNAGMVQFKEVFLGSDIRSYTRAASVQRCMRAGGKHNDLENVGYTARHHTFFEMLGNFSFGDYFKREAIVFAWQFLTEVLKLPPERLWVTVFRDDAESESIWLHDIKVDSARFSRCGEKDNFWQMGDTGPCGPCTEIFYDHGPDIAGGPPGSPEEDGDRYVEIWNLVFMQYDRDIHGKLKPLPKPCVDTGMGLERLSAVVQGVHDNYDIDLFMHLLRALSTLINHKNTRDTSMRVIVDHIRSVSFLIADGVIPSNEGRGYVLRRIIRRAVRHGYRLGQHKPFFYKLASALVEVMGDAYPELTKSEPLIAQIIEQEEEHFSKTLSKGLKILDQALEKLTGRQIPGDVVFQLYDTYGFPPDLTADIARERGLILDDAGFHTAMTHQREHSQQSHQFVLDHTQKVYIKGETEFVGYELTSAEGKVTTLLHDNKPVTTLQASETGAVVLDRTPFYAESGGQVGDTGYLYFDAGSFRVKNTQKQASVYLHIGEMIKGTLHVKDLVRAEVDSTRQDIALNHSATHLLHEALRRVLGEHVTQKGSLVEVRRLRFDFSHPKALTAQELQAVERLVNQQIRANLIAKVDIMTPEQAKETGALALFGERYGKTVRVLEMGDFSTEICGGTHVRRTGEIGLFKIVDESACASGVRRIEAVTGQAAILAIESQDTQLQTISGVLKTHRDNIFTKLHQLLTDQHHLEKELTQLKQKLITYQTADIAEQAINIDGMKVLFQELQSVETDILRDAIDKLKHKVDAVILAVVKDNKVQLAAGVSKKALTYFNATDLLNHVARQCGGRGGGRPDMAQGGGDSPQYLAKALQSVIDWVKEKINQSS